MTSSHSSKCQSDDCGFLKLKTSLSRRTDAPAVLRGTRLTGTGNTKEDFSPQAAGVIVRQAFQGRLGNMFGKQRTFYLLLTWMNSLEQQLCLEITLQACEQAAKLPHTKTTPKKPFNCFRKKFPSEGCLISVPAGCSHCKFTEWNWETLYWLQWVKNKIQVDSLGRSRKSVVNVIQVSSLKVR